MAEAKPGLTNTISLPITVKNAAQTREDKFLGSVLSKNCLIFLGLSTLCIFIMIIVATIVVSERTASLYKRDDVKLSPDPYRVIAHTIMQNWVHEFFHEKRTFNEAMKICRARGSELLRFNVNIEEPQGYWNFLNPHYEARFDAFVAQNFWKSTDYPDVKYWTAHFWVVRKERSDFSFFRTVDDRRVGTPFHFGKIRMCRVIGEGQLNALVKIGAWQEKHLIKDYVLGHQYTRSKEKNTNMTKEEQELERMREGRGCYNIISREDLTPEHAFYFVCQKRIPKPESTTKLPNIV